jgi:curli biogenesis system outer membrane secretion channel CsgG
MRFTTIIVCVFWVVSCSTNSAFKLGRESSSLIDCRSEIKIITETLFSNIDVGHVTRVAVLPLNTYDESDSKYGWQLSELIMTELVLARQYDVIERSQLENVIGEQKLSLSGLLEDGSEMNIGQLLGVDAIISGTISFNGSEAEIKIRLISVKNAKILSAASGSISFEREENVDHFEGIAKQNLNQSRQSDQFDQIKHSPPYGKMWIVVEGVTGSGKFWGPMTNNWDKWDLNKGVGEFSVMVGNDLWINGMIGSYYLDKIVSRDLGTVKLVDEKGNTYSFTSSDIQEDSSGNPNLSFNYIKGSFR